MTEQQTSEQLLDEDEINSQVDRVLLRMLQTPPDPHNVRTKKESRGRKIAPQMIDIITKRCSTMPRELRDDALQHAFLLFRSGDYKKSDLNVLLRAAMNAARRDQRGGHVDTYSLDTRACEDGDTAKDLLVSDDPPIEEILDSECEDAQ